MEHDTAHLHLDLPAGLILLVGDLLQGGAEGREHEARRARLRRMAGGGQRARCHVDARAGLTVHEGLLASLRLAIDEQAAHATARGHELGDEAGHHVGVHGLLLRVRSVHAVERHHRPIALPIKVESPRRVVLLIACHARGDG